MKKGRKLASAANRSQVIDHNGPYIERLVFYWEGNLKEFDIDDMNL